MGRIYSYPGRRGAEYCYSTEKYIGYRIKNSSGEVIASNSQKYSLTSSYCRNYKEKISINNKEYELVLSKVIPNATDPEHSNPMEQNEAVNTFIFHISGGNESAIVNVYSRNSELTASGSCIIDGTTVEVSYGSMTSYTSFHCKTE